MIPDQDTDRQDTRIRGLYGISFVYQIHSGILRCYARFYLGRDILYGSRRTVRFNADTREPSRTHKRIYERYSRFDRRRRRFFRRPAVRPRRLDLDVDTDPRRDRRIRSYGGISEDI